MTTYICPRCNYITKRKSNFKHHITRKNICMPINTDTSIKSIALSYGIDISSTENRLNITGATWNSTGGPFGEPCLSFDGSNDKVLDNTNGSSKPLWRDEVRLDNSPTAFSVSIWFYADGATDQDYILDIGILVLNWKHSSDTTYSQSFFGRIASYPHINM